MMAVPYNSKKAPMSLTAPKPPVTRVPKKSPMAPAARQYAARARRAAQTNKIGSY